MEEAKIVLEIIKSFIKNRECNLTQDFDEEKVYHLAKNHRISNFLYNWSKTAKSEKVKSAIQMDYNTQILKDTNENIELENILNKFEKANIKTLIVKGIIMKKVYPMEYMRQMCDIDILVEEKNFKKASQIMSDLGFDEFYDHEKHLIFTKSPIIVEMHRKLIPGENIAHEYFNNIWPLCINYNNYKNIYQMTVEDNYIFCIIHLLGHFKYAGIQIRDLLDVYLYNEKYKNIFDYEKINKKFEEFGVQKFEKNIKEIAYKWFGSEEIHDFDEVEQFILNGISIDNNVNYGISESKGKSQYILRLLFPEFKIMKEKYPVLKKAPVLLPVMWGNRIFKDIFSKETTVRDRFGKIELIKNADNAEIEKISKIYEKLGITGEEE